MQFKLLVDVYEQLEKISSGNTMREILANFFKTVPKEDISIVAHLTLGQIDSQYEGIVLGLAEKSIIKAIALASGQSETKVKELVQKKGDAGLAAEEVLHKKPRTLVPVGTLTIHLLYETLHKIAQTSGSGAQEKKTSLLASLLQKASPLEAKYLTRIVLGTLRMGVGEMTVLDALALAYTGEKKNKEILETAYNICPDVGEIAKTLAHKGLKGLEKIEIHVGRPIKKMPGKVAVEGKYDGERVQAHKDTTGKITLFSRRLDTITAQFPDLVKHLEKHVKAKAYVIEGETLAINKKGDPLPFQTLMQRRRKYDVEQYAKDIPIQLKIFELLYFDGKALFHEPYEKRLAQLQKILKEEEGVMPADRLITDDLEKIDRFFHEMLDQGYEGIMLKSLSGEYQAGTRGWNWIKWKKEYAKDLGDTFDLVVVGAYHGRGKRSGMYGALLCAAYNRENDSFETVCKLGTGLTDELLEELPKKLAKYKVGQKPARVQVSREMEPDVWFEPKIVVEVLAAEITKSPYHTLGLALRFPRFLHFRDDKKAEQATTTKEIKGMKNKK